MCSGCGPRCGAEKQALPWLEFSMAQQVLLEVETLSQSKSSAQLQMTLSWCFAVTPGCDFGHSQGSLLEGRMEKRKGVLIPTCSESLH